MKKVSFTIPGPPFGMQRPRFGNGRVYTPKKSNDYEKYVAYEYGRQCDNYRFLDDSPLKLLVVAYFEPPKSVSQKKREQMLRQELKPIKRPDEDNILKIVQDGLQNIAFGEDKVITDGHAIKRYGSDARVEVFISEDLE